MQRNRNKCAAIHYRHQPNGERIYLKSKQCVIKVLYNQQELDCSPLTAI